jgi:DNA-binding beta-propeller fold protein YncE
MRRVVLSLVVVGMMGAPVGAQPAKPVPAKPVPAKPVPGKPVTPAAPTKPVVVEKVEYAVTRTMKVGGEGMWDEAAIDAEGKFLYVPRTTRTQVIELATGKVVAEIGTGVGAGVSAGAKGIVLVPEAGRGFVTNNRDGTLTIFDLKTHAALGTIAVGQDAGTVVYDALSKRVFVACGAARQVVSVPASVDPKSGKPDNVISFEQGNPRGMVADGLGMVYVALGERDEIAVIDTRVMKVATAWGLLQFRNPGGLAIDRVRSRLFVTCGDKISVLSATDGHEMGGVKVRATAAWQFPSAPGAFHEGRVFAAAGDGALAILGQNAEGKFEVQQTLTVEVGARPAAVDAKSGKVYLPSVEMEGRKVVAGSFKVLVVERK